MESCFADDEYSLASVHPATTNLPLIVDDPTEMTVRTDPLVITIRYDLNGATTARATTYAKVVLDFVGREHSRFIDKPLMADHLFHSWILRRGLK